MKANGTRWGWQNPRFGTSGLQIRWSGAMKTNVVFFTIMMLGLIGCNPVHKRQSSVVSNDSTNINMISIETNLKDTTAFRPVLLHEITSFIDKYKQCGYPCASAVRIDGDPCGAHCRDKDRVQAEFICA